jgi:hypothetical protein
MTDASTETMSSEGNPFTCWGIDDRTYGFQVKACPTTLMGSIDVMADVSIDTDTGISNPSGLTCASLGAGSSTVCALAARTIKIEAGKTLSAHGTKPLALIGNSIDIEGTIDVASRIRGQRGPASNLTGCNPRAAATKSGGGAGGALDIVAGKGGDEGGTAGTGGAAGTSIAIVALRGGCDGGRGGDGSGNGGPAGAGGVGGGAVWIAVDTGTFTIGASAVINASGASGGGGGAMADHGGYGGGSGGMIVLQAPTITMMSGARIYANGGHGGGGAQSTNVGVDGSDSTGPTSGGADGDGGTAAGGAGGGGFPASTLNGSDGDSTMGKHGGGGGGGGGAGVIRVASGTTIGPTDVSPPPLPLTP